jgi:hypothetical protein
MDDSVVDAREALCRQIFSAKARTKLKESSDDDYRV